MTTSWLVTFQEHLNKGSSRAEASLLADHWLISQKTQTVDRYRKALERIVEGSDPEFKFKDIAREALETEQKS